MGQSVIEINGTKYDATTGEVVLIEPTVRTLLINQRGNIDGIVSKDAKASLPTPVHKPVIVAPRTKEELSKQRRVHDISMVQAGRSKKSKTLMRSVVKKPDNAHPKNHPISYTSSPIARSGSYTSSATSDIRLNKALTTPTNSQVSRFRHSQGADPKIQPTIVSHMPVRAPATAPLHHSVVPTVLITKATSSAAAKFVDTQLSKVANTEPDTPFKKKPLRKRFSSKLRSNKLKSIGVSTVAVLLIGGFITYQNLPTITLAIANKDAGISAKIPKGIPSNFAISPKIDRSPGQVVLSFNSRVDDRSFTLTQVKADTTIQSLKDVIARVSDNQFQTYEAGGITLFLSNDNRADWMDGGMRYNITGKTGFSPDQIAQIASSL